MTELTTRSRLRRLAKLVLGVCVAGILLAFTAIYLYPIELGSWFMRARMTTVGGMTEEVFPGPDGPITVFIGGPKDGTPIVLVHGLEDHAGTWWQTAPALVERGWRVIAYDQPGHGESGPTEGELTSEQLYRGLEAVVAAYSERPVMVGNSLGGAVVLRFALDHPDDVRHLVLVDSAGMAFTPDETLFLPESADDTARTMRAVMGPDAMLPPRFVMERMVDTIHSGATPRLWKSISTAKPLEPELGQVSVPTDVVWGAHDTLLSVDLGKRMADGIPEAGWHVIERCGHSPQVLCPDRFNALLFELLEPIWRSSTVLEN